MITALLRALWGRLYACLLDLARGRSAHFLRVLRPTSG